MSPAFRAHPEFGYFCLSRRFRRALLATLAVIAVGALACAIVVGGGGDSRDDAAPAPGPIDAASSGAAPPPAVDQAIATAARPGPTESAKPVCEGETWTYLDGKCIAGKPQKPRITAIESAPIAALPIGRIAPPPASPAAKTERADEAAAAAPVPKPERVAEAAAVPPSKSRPAAETTASAPAPAATAPAAAEPAVQSSSTSKERRKASRERASRDERRGTRTASSDNRRPRSAMGWTKQVRSAEQLMRVLFSSGI